MQDLEHNSQMTAQPERAIVLPGELPALKGGFQMARKRFQRGTLKLRGVNPVWVGRWREDILEDGQVRRIEKSVVLGTKEEYPTRKLALRELEKRLSTINRLDYRPTPVAKFKDFAEMWQKSVLPNFKPSNHAPIRSNLKRHLIPLLGGVSMGDINGIMLQSLITQSKLGPRTIKNVIGTLRILWNTAKTWGYVNHNPFDALVFPEWEEQEQPAFSPEDVQRILAAIDPYYVPALWFVTQTGVRRGELCALNIGDVNFDRCLVVVRRSRYSKHITNTKSKRPRCFPLSAALVAQLRQLAEGRKPDEPMFTDRAGKRLHPDNWVSRVLKPVLRQLGLQGALHAFRHGNASAQDELGVPLKQRMDTLGHVKERTTMMYTHVLTDSARQVPEKLDDYFGVGRKVQ